MHAMKKVEFFDKEPSKLYFDSAWFKQYDLSHFLFLGLQPLLDILERYGGWPVVKGDEWLSDGWDWLEMSKNMSNDGLPSNSILDVKVGNDHENFTQNIIQVKWKSFTVHYAPME